MSENTDVAVLQELVSEATTRFIVKAQRRGDEGGQLVYRFPSGYGASVVRYGYRIENGRLSGTYGVEDGLFEMAVIRFTDDDPVAEYVIDQEHPLAADGLGVLGYLTAREVEEHLLTLRREQSEE